MNDFTCCICNSRMGDEDNNECWPCCSSKCEHVFFNERYELQQDMEDVILNTMERDW